MTEYRAHKHPLHHSWHLLLSAGVPSLQSSFGPVTLKGRAACTGLIKKPGVCDSSDEEDVAMLFAESEAHAGRPHNDGFARQPACA
jgi:hypothetical protein